MTYRFLLLLLLGSINLIAKDATTDSYLSSAYLLCPVDKLAVSIYGQADLYSVQRISDSGTVSIPLLGEINIGGLTVSQAQQKIENAFIAERYLVRPVATINIEEFSPKIVTVLGEVEAPGSIKIPDGRNGLSIQVAIAEAGGFTGAALKSEVQLQRNSVGNTKDLQHNVVINVSKILESGKKIISPVIAGPDDVLFVPRRLF